MKVENKSGPAVIGEHPELVEYTAETLLPALADQSVIMVDSRHNSEVHEGTVPRSLNIPSIAKAASYGAWVYDPTVESRPLVLLASSAADAVTSPSVRSPAASSARRAWVICAISAVSGAGSQRGAAAFIV